MEDWQIAVLNSKDLRVDQNENAGYRLVIRKTDSDNRMSIEKIVSTIKASNRKPAIMRPSDPLTGKFAERKEVLNILMAREDFQEYMALMTEAKLNGVI